MTNKSYQLITLANESSLPTNAPAHVMYFTEETNKYWLFINSVLTEVFNNTNISGFLLADGSVQLTNDWNAGTFNITTQKFISTSDSDFNGVNVGIGGGFGINNTAVGSNSLQISTGSFNTAIGSQVLRFNESGSYNTGLGESTLSSNTTGNNNTALGSATLTSNTTGSDNIALGQSALSSNSVGSWNIAIGSYSQQASSSSENNVSIGYLSLSSNSIGNQNTALGNYSLYANTTGANNVSIGYYSLGSNSTGSENTAIGTQSLTSNTVGAGNTSIGYSSLLDNIDGDGNTAVGYFSLQNNTYGSSNTVLGPFSLGGNTTGYSNIAIGYSAGSLDSFGVANASGNRNIFIGDDTSPLNTGGNNEIVIGDSSVGYGSNTVTIGRRSATNGTYLHGELNLVDNTSTYTTTFTGAGLTNDRTLSIPDASGTIALTSDLTGGTVTSVGLTMPAAFNVANTPITSTGDINVTANGLSSQYIRGDGQLANFPTQLGGGSSVNYYANGGTNQGTFSGNTYYQLSTVANTGVNVDFTLNNVTPTVRFITDLNNPDQVTIPQGSWIFRTYLAQNNNSGNCNIQISLYKYDGTTFTLINTGQLETITGGTTLDLYTHAVTIPSGVVLNTNDRLAIEYTAGNFGGSRTVTLHTQDSHLAQIQTTYSTGLNTLNGLTDQVQYFQTGTANNDFSISSTGDTHTFNLPTASATKRGALNSTDWTIFNNKIDGTGTVNYLQKMTSSSVLGDSLIYDNGISVGIGTITPSYKFEVTADSSFNGVVVGRGAGNINTNTVVGLNSLTSNSTGSENIAVGVNAMITNISGFRNVALGPYSLYSNTLGGQNIAVGMNSLRTNLTGTNNIGIGYQALYSGAASVANIGIGTNSLFTNTGSYNIAIGLESLRNSTTGSYNTSIGYQSLYTNITGEHNLAIGYRAGYFSTGNSNSFVGSLSGYANTSGSNNAGFGYGALYANTTGSNNTAIGLSALSANTIGSGNTAIGTSSGYSNTTGTSNTSVGTYSLFDNTIGTGLTAIGTRSLQFNISGNYNTGIGYASLYNNLTGSYNTGIGFDSLNGNTIGSYNTAVGHQAALDNISGAENTAFGYQALRANQTTSKHSVFGYGALNGHNTGDFTVAVGHYAGSVLIDGTTPNTENNNNIFIGPYTRSFDASTTNEIIIGYNVFGKGTNTTTIGKQGTTTDTYLAGSLTINNAYKLPNIDGNNGEILITNGAGILTWTDTNNFAAYVKVNGTTPLTADWNAGNFEIQTEKLISNTPANINNVLIGGGSNSNIAIGDNSTIISDTTTGIDNIQIGHSSMINMTSAEANIAIGRAAMRFITTGYANIALGDSSQVANINGGLNVSIGINSLANNQSGSHNTVVGSDALGSILSTSNNVALGHNAGTNIFDGITGNTLSTNSIFIGAQTKSLNNNDDNQIVIGYNVIGNGSNTVTIGDTSMINTYIYGGIISNIDAYINGVTIGKGGNSIATNVILGTGNLPGNTTGQSNTAIGYVSMSSNDTGSFNSAVGMESLGDNISGSNNTVHGYRAAYKNQSGSNNTIIGFEAMRTGNSSNNTAVGQYALYNINNLGGSNIGIGIDAGRYIASGATATANQSCLFIGNDARPLAINSSNEIVIGSSARGKGTNTVTIGHTTITDTWIRGTVHINDLYKLPTTDGTSGQAIVTDGAGNLSFSTISGGGGSPVANTLIAMTELTSNTLVTHTVPTGANFTAINLNSDATNRYAKITFTAPSSGKVSINMEFDMTIVNSAAVQMIGLHTSSTATTTPALGYYRLNTDNDATSGQFEARFIVTGLTSGVTYSYYFMGVSDFSSNTIRISKQQTTAYVAGSDLPQPLRIFVYDLGTVGITSNPSS